MQKELFQKRIFTKREARIMENKIVYKSTLFGRENEVSIAYEDLSRYKDSYFLNRIGFYIPIFILSFFTLVSYTWRNDKDFQRDLGEYHWVFWSFLLLASVIVYIISLENLWKVRVQNNTYLFFFKTLPNRKEVDDFLECLFQTRDSYLKETYFLESTKNLSFESQKNNLQWLRRAEVITREEFKESMEKLGELFNYDLKKIGFN